MNAFFLWFMYQNVRNG